MCEPDEEKDTSLYPKLILKIGTSITSNKIWLFFDH